MNLLDELRGITDSLQVTLNEVNRKLAEQTGIPAAPVLLPAPTPIEHDLPAETAVPTLAWRPTEAAFFLASRTGNPWTTHKLRAYGAINGWVDDEGKPDSIHVTEAVLGLYNQSGTVYLPAALQAVLNDPDAWGTVTRKKGTNLAHPTYHD